MAASGMAIALTQTAGESVGSDTIAPGFVIVEWQASLTAITLRVVDTLTNRVNVRATTTGVSIACTPGEESEGGLDSCGMIVNQITQTKMLYISVSGVRAVKGVPGCNSDLEDAVVAVWECGALHKEVNQAQTQVRGQNKLAQVWARVEVKRSYFLVQQPCSNISIECGSLPE